MATRAPQRSRKTHRGKLFPAGGRDDLFEAKREIATALRTKFERDGTTVAEFARRIGTNRTAVRRILDEKNTAISLKTMFKALAAAGLKITLTTRQLSAKDLVEVAQRMVDAPTKTEQDSLQQDFIDGFYGKHVPRPSA